MVIDSVGSIMDNAIGVSMHWLAIDARCIVLWKNQCPTIQPYMIVREIYNYYQRV